MDPAQRQQNLARELLLIEDPQERLAFVQDRARRLPFPAEARTDQCRIQGCVTRVWLHAACASEAAEKRCTFEVDSESAMVRGLAALIAEVYSQCAPEKVRDFECTILAEARLERLITPTRLHGLAQLQLAIRRFAAGNSPAHSE